MGITVANRVSLMTAYPNIVKEWHPSLNAFSPLDVTSHSHKRAWWKCEGGHEWEAVINNRTSNGTTCPYCSGRVPTPTSSLGYLRPDLVAEWHPTKNKVTPYDVAQYTQRAVWWKCEQGHEWKANVANRTNMGSGCPYCKGNLHTPETCLAAVYPEIASEWHPTKNDRTPHEVTKSGKYVAWWKCSVCDQEWRTSVNNRTDKNSGCPTCKTGLSSSEAEIRLWAEMVHVFGQENVRHRYRDLGFELDIFIPALRAGIEYDGLRWHQDKVEKDTKKYELARKHNIFLIRVTEIPDVPADEIIIAKKMPHHLVQKIVRTLQKIEGADRFSEHITSYLNTTGFQNYNLFKATYEALIRKRL